MELGLSDLKGEIVTLEVLNLNHLESYHAASSDQSIWRYMPFALNEKSMVELFIGHVSGLPEKGEAIGYAVRHHETGRIIGGTGYWHVDHQHSKLEIGGSWLVPEFQGSGVNTEVKQLLLTNAFEVLHCNRVAFSIHSGNLGSLRAIERIGAKKEGVLRSDMKMHDGTIRDSVIYSIVSGEWPVVKKRLTQLQEKYA